MAKLLGPYSAAFGDLQIAKGADPAAVQPPLLRIYYPCVSHGHSKKSAWLPSTSYAYGYLSNVARPSTSLRKGLVWFLSCIVYVLLLPGASIAAAVAKPLLTEDSGSDRKEQFPVVVFSHGLWACRTTYSTFCADLASYGYIVVAPEHLDGSANMACYIGDNGKHQWVHHKYRNANLRDFTIKERAGQLKQRVKEIEIVLRTLDSLNSGLIKSNLVTGEERLDIKMFEGRIDIDRMAIAGHSFGGATAVIAPGVIDNRFKCCLGLDVWWEPVEQLDYEKVSGKIPVFLLNTEKFDWKTLNEARLRYLNARAEATKDGKPLVTTLATIKHTCHQDQSDLPLFLPGICKRLKLSGDLDVQLAKDINSRACLEFLENYMRLPGRKYPAPFTPVESDKEYLVSAEL